MRFWAEEERWSDIIASWIDDDDDYHIIFLFVKRKEHKTKTSGAAIKHVDEIKSVRLYRNIIQIQNKEGGGFIH